MPRGDDDQRLDYNSTEAKVTMWERQMTAKVTVRIDSALAAEAQKMADLDGVSLERFVESVLQRHIEFVGRAHELTICPEELRANFTLRRAPEETDEEYEERRRLLFG